MARLSPFFFFESHSPFGFFYKLFVRNTRSFLYLGLFRILSFTRSQYFKCALASSRIVFSSLIDWPFQREFSFYGPFTAYVRTRNVLGCDPCMCEYFYRPGRVLYSPFALCPPFFHLLCYHTPMDSSCRDCSEIRGHADPAYAHRCSLVPHRRRL